ncbi:Polycystin-2 [Lamellibrachia satsuma]|nr:Polycystin-2 [Lamellibrachia satsuma]
MRFIASCDVVDIMRQTVRECRREYNVFSEEKRNFTTGWSLLENDTDDSRIALTYKYHSMFELQGLPTYGRRGLYGGGGYVADLGTSQRQARSLLRELSIEWIDVYTRAVFVEFTIYNPNVNLFAFVNLLTEFPATGGLLRHPRVDSFHVYSAVGSHSTVVVVVQMLFIFILVYQVIRQLLKFKKQRREYFKDPWNFIEVAVIVTSVVAVAMYVAREFLSRLILRRLMKNRDAYTNYSTLATYNNRLTMLVGAVVFLTNVKFLRILRFNKHIIQFANTLKHLRSDLTSFSVIFGTVFVAFSTSGYLVLGRERRNFSTFWVTFQTLFAMLIGKFDLVGITGQVNRSVESYACMRCLCMRCPSMMCPCMRCLCMRCPCMRCLCMRCPCMPRPCMSCPCMRCPRMRCPCMRCPCVRCPSMRCPLYAVSVYAMSVYELSEYVVSVYAVSEYAVSVYAVSEYAVSEYAFSMHAVTVYAVSEYAVSVYAVSDYAVSVYAVSEYAVSVYAVSEYAMSVYAVSVYAVTVVLIQMFFVIFSVVVFFILVNVFLSILLIGYTKTRSSPVSIDERYDIVRFIQHQIWGFFARNKQRSKETGEGDYEANLVRLQEQLRRLDDIVRGVRPDRQSNKVISDPGHCSR